jgi:prepilin-type N-terminal cleavage/methylation domain-containing protein
MLSRLVNKRGFTLLETIAALTILVVVLNQLFSASSSGVRNESRSDFLLHASREGQALLAGLGIEKKISPGTEEGRFEDGLLWSLLVESKGSVGRSFDPTVFNIYYINLTIRRPAGSVDTLNLTTLKIIESARS